MSKTSRSKFNVLRLTLRAQPRSKSFKFGHSRKAKWVDTLFRAISMAATLDKGAQKMTARASWSLPASVDALRAGLLELVNVCPVERCNPVDCPLFPLRKMERRRRRLWFNALDRTDLEYLATYHHVCMNVRLNARRLAV